MGASGSKDSLADAIGALRTAEVTPAGDGADVYAALWTLPDSWEELAEAFPAEAVREVREAHPRNLAFLLSQVTSALELALAAEGEPAEARTAAARGCLRLLARVLPFLAGDARLGCGAPDGRADLDGSTQASAQAAATASAADVALQELSAFLAGGPLPAPREDAWHVSPPPPEAVAAVCAVVAEEAGPVSGADVAAAAAAVADMMRSEYTAPPPAEGDAPPGGDGASAGEPAVAALTETAAAAASAAAALPPPPPLEPRLGEPLWRRIAAAVAGAALCGEVALPRRASAWAPPLAPGATTPPPDAEFVAARLEALRALSATVAAEALVVPFAPAHDADAVAPTPTEPTAPFLAAFSGRCAFPAPLHGTTPRRLFNSLLNGASCAPGLTADSPDGAALVVACMRALLLLVCVAEEDVPIAAATPDESAPAMFAEMALPQAACLHASVAAVLATAAAAAVSTAEWADVLVETVVGGGEAARVLSHTPPPGAAEAVALALAAAERAPAFADVAAGRSGSGGWLLAGPVLTLMLVLRDEPSAAGLLRAGSFLLLNLGSSKAFGVALNEPLRPSDAPLASAAGLGPPLPPGATRADALLAALAALLAYPLARGASIGRERPLYAPLLAVLLNAAPYLKGVTPPGAGAWMHLLAALAQPSVLLRDAAGAPLLRSVLDALAAALLHQADANPALCGALLRHGALLEDLVQLRLPVDVADKEAETKAGAEMEAAEPRDSATSAAGNGDLFGGLRLVGPAQARPAFAPDNAWLDGVRASWPLAQLGAVAAALSPAYSAWRESRPAAHVYEEAEFLRAQPLAGVLPPPPSRGAHVQRTYARTRGVAAWQARHAAGLALLADPGAVDAPRVRRLRVALRDA